MSIVKFIHTDLGVIVVVAGDMSDEERYRIVEALRLWARVSEGFPSPFLVVRGDEHTTYLDLRTAHE